MKGIVSQFVISVFLLALMWTGVSYCVQNMQYSSARDFHHFVVQQIEDSDFDQTVLDMCKNRARERGYTLAVKQYGGNQRDARITLKFVFQSPVIQKKKQYVIDGYAR